MFNTLCLRRPGARPNALLHPRHETRRHKSSHRPAASGKGEGGLFGGLFGGLLKPQGGAAPAPPGKAAPAPSMLFPPYTVIKRAPAYDLRLYAAYPCVKMPYERREQAYLSLGQYIDGEGNAAGARFAHTNPTIMEYFPDGRKTMEMFIASRDPENPITAAQVMQLPEPVNPECTLDVAGGALVAVLKFEGYITPDAAAAARKKLVAALEADGIQLAEAEAAGGFRIAQYGPIFQLQTRVNEMMLRVKP